jgi:hypothetical protein
MGGRAGIYFLQNLDLLKENKNFKRGRNIPIIKISFKYTVIYASIYRFTTHRKSLKTFINDLNASL